VNSLNLKRKIRINLTRGVDQQIVTQTEMETNPKNNNNCTIRRERDEYKAARGKKKKMK
jgi:hypothetical protein